MRNSRFSSGLLAAAFILTTLAPISSRAQSAAPTMDEALAAIAAYAPRALAEQGAPGMSVAITDRTHTLRIITAGYANLDTKAPVTPDTRFPIGSISKSMTTLLLLQMHDRGLIDLQAPVTTYLPWWRIQGTRKPILIHQLLSHTAGIPDDYTFVSSYGFAVAALRDAHEIFQPGTAWAYSNDGFATIGAVVAAVGKAPWQEQLASGVFAPAGMTHSSAYFTPRDMEDAATGYEVRDIDRPQLDHPALIAAQNYDFVDPAGSVISTPADMAAYMRLYLNGGKTADGHALISHASFVAMTNADHLANGKPAGAAGVEMAEWPSFYKQYGYGLSVFHKDGDHLIGHTGGVSGYTACMQANLTRGFGAIAMANLVESPLHPCAIVKYAMAVLRAQQLGQALPAAPAPPPSPNIVPDPAQYAGTYTATDGSTIAFAADGRELTTTLHGATYPVFPQGNDTFATHDPRLRMFYTAFHRDKQRRVYGFNNGSKLYYKAGYVGPRSFSHPASWNALVGRYEAVIWGQPIIVRTIIVGDRLTFDGISPLRPQKDGSFLSDTSRVRFDTPAAGQMQRLWIDGGDLYRIDLP